MNSYKDIITLLRAEVPVMWEQCDSPIENDFLWAFQKVAAQNISLTPQYVCPTPTKEYRVDFAIFGSGESQRVGIECDGREFHNIAQDAKRDTEIVKAGLLAKVYRVSGSSIFHRVHDVLELLSIAEPWMFSDRGRTQLEVLSAPSHLREDIWGYLSDTMQGGVTRQIEQNPNEEEPEEYTRFCTDVTIRWTPGPRQPRT